MIRLLYRFAMRPLPTRRGRSWTVAADSSPGVVNFDRRGDSSRQLLLARAECLKHYEPLTESSRALAPELECDRWRARVEPGLLVVREPRASSGATICCGEHAAGTSHRSGLRVR